MKLSKVLRQLKSNPYGVGYTTPYGSNVCELSIPSLMFNVIIDLVQGDVMQGKPQNVAHDLLQNKRDDVTSLLCKILSHSYSSSKYKSEIKKVEGKLNKVVCEFIVNDCVLLAKMISELLEKNPSLELKDIAYVVDPRVSDRSLILINKKLLNPKESKESKVVRRALGSLGLTTVNKNYIYDAVITALLLDFISLGIKIEGNTVTLTAEEYELLRLRAASVLNNLTYNKTISGKVADYLLTEINKSGDQYRNGIDTLLVIMTEKVSKMSCRDVSPLELDGTVGESDNLSIQGLGGTDLQTSLTPDSSFIMRETPNHGFSQE